MASRVLSPPATSELARLEELADRIVGSVQLVH